MTCGIYKITNKQNGHCYIGQSVNIEERWRVHRSTGRNTNHENKNYPLYRAIYLYGLDNFEFSIIEECSKEELNQKEEYWISYYNSFEDGYNQTKGGNNTDHLGKLNSKQLEEIKNLLKNTNIREEDIALKYHVSLISISNINIGKYRFDNTIEYPIRKIKKYYCQNCGKELSNKTKTCLCAECYRNSETLHIPSREILKEKIRKQSFESIAKEYGFKTGNTPKKWCKKLNLPYLKFEINKYSDEEWELI